MYQVGDKYFPLNRRIIYICAFQPLLGPDAIPVDFSAFDAARKWLQDLGYSVADVDLDWPSGFFPAVDHRKVQASKWSHVFQENRIYFHGVIRSEDFRHKVVEVIFCEAPVNHIPFVHIPVHSTIDTSRGINFTETKLSDGN